MSEQHAGVDDIWADWQQAVNMTRAELENWLQTDESRSVGDKQGGGESVGHHSGRRILDILDKKKPDLTSSDAEWMRKVVGYVHRHRAQGPASDVEHSRWRYSLMNWGNDPLKD
ncbi:MAG: DUF3140 domain-containing protein [Nakamurella sp.]